MTAIDNRDDSLYQRVTAALDSILSGSKPWVRIYPLTAQQDPPRVLVPGSFNPLHDGHLQMAAIAAKLTSTRVDLELSITNAEKPDASTEEIHQRILTVLSGSLSAEANQFGVVLTNEPLFAEKSKLFPGVTFVAGADTLLRIADHQYHDNDQRKLERALKQFQKNGCQFLVFGRLIKQQFCELGSIQIPDQLRAICTGVNEADFRVDISSTNLRNGLE